MTLITGGHRLDFPNRPMISITDNEKLPENDQDIVLENDVWIGANATILKGLTVGRQCYRSRCGGYEGRPAVFHCRWRAG